MKRWEGADLSCLSAAASRSASGSLANTTVAPSLSASVKDSVCDTHAHTLTHLQTKQSVCVLWLHAEPTRTPSPSSGLGYLTVGNSGSGSLCSSTAYGGRRSKAWKADWTKAWPTPWTDVCTIFTSELLFMSLRREMAGMLGWRQRSELSIR